MKKDFDILLNKDFQDNIHIDYGIIKGNNKIVFIKVGQNGTIYGYKNKYLKIAISLNKKYGYTIICSSNPFDNNITLDNDISIIKEYCKNNDIKSYEVYYIGHSKGGTIGAQYGYKYSCIKRMLLINAPLMINYHKTKDGLSKFNQEQVIMVYGDLDPSYKYTELLNGIQNKKFKYFIIKGQDHHFSKSMIEFKKIPEKYLIKNIIN